MSTNSALAKESFAELTREDLIWATSVENTERLLGSSRIVAAVGIIPDLPPFDFSTEACEYSLDRLRKILVAELPGKVQDVYPGETPCRYDLAISYAVAGMVHNHRRQNLLKFPGLSSSGEPISQSEPPPVDLGEIRIEVCPIKATDRNPAAVVLKFSRAIDVLSLDASQAVELSGLILKADQKTRE